MGPVLVRAVSGGTGAHLAGMGLTFLVGVQLARGLGAEGYGVYGIAMSVIALITIPTQFGLPPLITREVASAQAQGDASRVHGVVRWATRTVLTISVVEVVVIVVVLAICSGHIDGPVSRALLHGLPLVPLVALGNLRGAALRGLRHIAKGQLPDLVIRPAAFSVLLLAYTLIGGDVLTSSRAIFLHAIAAVIALTAGTGMLRRFIPPRPDVFSISNTASSAWLSSAIPMALTQGARVLQAHLVVLLMGTLSTPASVGTYRAASAVSLAIATPITLLNVVAAPFFAGLHAQGDAVRLRRMLGWVAGVMLAGVIALSLPFVLAGEAMMVFAFGPEFGPSAVPLLVLCCGVTLSASMGANGALLNMTGQEKAVTRAFLTSLMCLVVIAPPLIHAYDALGAAAAQATTVTVWNVLLWRCARASLGLDTSVLSLLRRSRADEEAEAMR